MVKPLSMSLLFLKTLMDVLAFCSEFGSHNESCGLDSVRTAGGVRREEEGDPDQQYPVSGGVAVHRAG